MRHGNAPWINKAKKKKKKKSCVYYHMSGKNGSVGRDLLLLLFLTQTTEMHILAVIMLHQHAFFVYHMTSLLFSG